MKTFEAVEAVEAVEVVEEVYLWEDNECIPDSFQREFDGLLGRQSRGPERVDWRKNSSDIATSGSTQGKLGCGTRLESDLMHVTCWNVSQHATIQDLCGGTAVPTHQQGVKILGTPFGHVDFAHTELELVAMDHQVLLDRITGVPDVQAAWLLLLHCAQAREFARRHDAELFQCVGNILEQDLSHCGDEVREMAGLPLILGGLGLRSAERERVPAYWRHPSVAM